jgi:hypothetical protein
MKHLNVRAEEQADTAGLARARGRGQPMINAYMSQAAEKRHFLYEYQ